MWSIFFSSVRSLSKMHIITEIIQMDSKAELNRELVNQHWIWKNSLTVQMAITFIQWNLVQSTLSFKSLGFVRSVRGHWIQNSLLHAVWTEMCLGSVWPQPPYNDKNTPLFRHRSRQECLLSDWGVLLLDVIMNIAVVIYSWHLSCWKWRKWITFALEGNVPPSLVKNIDISINIDTEISERYQY